MNKKATLALKEVVIAIIVLIVLGVIIYVAFGPSLMKAAGELFNRTGNVADKAVEKSMGELISKFSFK